MRYIATRWVDTYGPGDDVTDAYPLEELERMAGLTHIDPSVKRVGATTWPAALGAAQVAALEAAGLTPGRVAGMTDDDLLTVEGVGPATVKKLREG